MADIPRVPQVTPPALVNPQVHRVDGSRDRPGHGKKDRQTSAEDVIELHEEAVEPPSPASSHDETDEGHFDIAV
jgi:hypothetical protein